MQDTPESPSEATHASVPSNEASTTNRSAATPSRSPGAKGATPSPPPPMHWEGTVTFGIEAGDPWSTCEGPLSSCDKRPFHTNGTFDLEATLAWDAPANDLDLFLYRDDGPASTRISSDGINGASEPGGASQTLHQSALPAGDYRLWVATRHGGLVAYRLDATFHSVKG